MQITVVALLCHSVVSTASCREEVIMQADAGIPLGCMFAEGQLDQWKEHSIYRGNQWSIARIKCVPGNYVIKDAI